MGLASKLAASQAPGYQSAGVQPGQQQGLQNTGSYQTQAPPHPNPYSTPPSGLGNQHAQVYANPQPQTAYQPNSGNQRPPGYGYPSQYPHSQYGNLNPPAPVQTQNVDAYLQLLESAVVENELGEFYPNSAVLKDIAGGAENKVSQICREWNIPMEVGRDIVKLALFDIILYIDDSGSMLFGDDGERIKDLKLILARVAYAASLFDRDGVEVRFMHCDSQGNHIENKEQVEDLVGRVKFYGLTPMGTKLKERVLEPLIIGPAKLKQLKKPVLVITITDGKPEGEDSETIFRVIKNASIELARCVKGRVVFYQFAQVGSDLGARKFLGELDSNQDIGELIDSTSSFEVEQDEMSKLQPPVELTPELWLVKLLLGAIDSSYDKKDEKDGSRPQATPRQYGVQPDYGAPHSGVGYGGPPCQGATQQPYPPPQYPSRQLDTQQQQYPPQQLGYGGHGGPSGTQQQPVYGGPPPQQPGYGGHGGPSGTQQQPVYGGPPPQQPGYGGYGVPSGPPQPGYGGPPYPSYPSGPGY